MKVTVLGIDLAKRVFQLHAADRHGRALRRSKVNRVDLLITVQQLQPEVVAMEACSSAHHWARRFQELLGMEVRLISPQYVARLSRPIRTTAMTLKLSWKLPVGPQCISCSAPRA